jgi:hypothetical protein
MWTNAIGSRKTLIEGAYQIRMIGPSTDHFKKPSTRTDQVKDRLTDRSGQGSVAHQLRYTYESF